ncbi:MAG: transporter substrate-binding domain-containing protein [Bacteroidetes bacterium]|nr:transporter substrate-binding domain-containing protein [Bacteroidota bacterium]
MIKNKFIILLILFSLSNLSLFAEKTIKIGAYENKPKIFTNNNGETVGFWVDITNYIAAKEKWKIEWVTSNWEECLQKLKNNEIHIMVDVGESSARKEKFIFSKETVLLSCTVLYTQKGTNLQSIFELEGRTIACLKKSINLSGSQGLKANLKNSNINCKIIEMTNYSKIFEAISKGEIFAGITNKDFGAENEINIMSKEVL